MHLLSPSHTSQMRSRTSSRVSFVLMHPVRQPCFLACHHLCIGSLICESLSLDSSGPLGCVYIGHGDADKIIIQQTAWKRPAMRRTSVCSPVAQSILTAGRPAKFPSPMIWPSTPRFLLEITDCLHSANCPAAGHRIPKTTMYQLMLAVSTDDLLCAASHVWEMEQSIGAFALSWKKLPCWGIIIAAMRGDW